MKFTRIDAHLEICRTHLDASGARGTVIEQILVGFLLVAVVSEFDRRLKSIVVKRVERIGDGEVVSFVRATAWKHLRSVNVGELVGCLGHFGKTCASQFQTTMQTPGLQAAYDNVWTNRRTTAHEEQLPMMTLLELERMLPQAISVIDAFAAAIGLTAAEIAELEAGP
jgi:hypothetical protein